MKVRVWRTPCAPSPEVKEQYEKQLRELQQAYGEAMLELRARKNWPPAGQRGRNDPQPLSRDWLKMVSRSAWSSCASGSGCLGARCTTAAPRRHRRCGSTRTSHQGHDRREPVLRLPHGGAPAGVQQKNTVQRIFQIQGWQVRKRPVGFRPLHPGPCPRWPRRQTSAGPRTCAGYGRAMAGLQLAW